MSCSACSGPPVRRCCSRWAAWHRVVLVVLLLRFGFLTFATALIGATALAQAPLTTDLSAWYVGTGALYVLALAGPAVYGFIIALGGRSLFEKGFFGDE